MIYKLKLEKLKLKKNQKKDEIQTDKNTKKLKLIKIGKKIRVLPCFFKELSIKIGFQVANLIF